MTLLQIYFWLSAAISVYCLLKMPLKQGMTALDHLGGSLVVGIAFGFFLWPFAIWALRIKRRQGEI